MNREFKFRYIVKVGGVITKIFVTLQETEKGFGISPEIQILSRSQYSGLPDKNGVDIYEDDIVLTPTGHCSVIEYAMAEFGLNHDYGTENKTMLGAWAQKHNLRTMSDGYNEYIEVVGNTIENPDIITKQ